MKGLNEMIGFGTIVNVIAIIIGGGIGFILKHNLKEKYKEIMMQAIGLAILIAGFYGALSGIMYFDNDLVVFEITCFLILGSVIGSYLQIAERLTQFGDYIQSKLKSKGTFSTGFVRASLIFVIGTMAILGPINDGLRQDYSILYTKSILDGTTSMILASTLGIGVLFSSVPVFIYQGLITLFAFLIRGFVTYGDITSMTRFNDITNAMGVVGNILIIGIGLDLLEIKKIKVANMLPAVFIPILYFILKAYLV